MRGHKKEAPAKAAVLAARRRKASARRAALRPDPPERERPSLPPSGPVSQLFGKHLSPAETELLKGLLTTSLGPECKSESFAKMLAALPDEETRLWVAHNVKFTKWAICGWLEYMFDHPNGFDDVRIAPVLGRRMREDGLFASQVIMRFANHDRFDAVVGLAPGFRFEDVWTDCWGYTIVRTWSDACWAVLVGPGHTVSRAPGLAAAVSILANFGPLDRQRVRDLFSAAIAADECTNQQLGKLALVAARRDALDLVRPHRARVAALSPGELLALVMPGDSVGLRYGVTPLMRWLGQRMPFSELTQCIGFGYTMEVVNHSPRDIDFRGALTAPHLRRDPGLLMLAYADGEPLRLRGWELLHHLQWLVSRNGTAPHMARPTALWLATHDEMPSAVLRSPDLCEWLAHNRDPEYGPLRTLLRAAYSMTLMLGQRDDKSPLSLLDQHIVRVILRLVINR